MNKSKADKPEKKIESVKEYIEKVKAGRRKTSRHSFSNCRDVADIWAAEIQDRANCTNAFFEDKKLYSYGRHYLLGLIVNYRGHKVALINRDRYSVTTSGHSSDAYWAARNAGLIVIDTDGDFTADAVRMGLQNQANSIIDQLSQAQADGFWFWVGFHRSKRELEREIRELNSLAKKLGHSDLVIRIPKNFWAPIAELTRLKRLACIDRNQRKQLSLESVILKIPNSTAVFPYIHGRTRRRLDSCHF